MTLDLSDPDHEAALRWACARVDWVPVQYIGEHKYNAQMAIRNPAAAAELIRQLVERAGVKIEAMGPRDLYLAIYVVDGDSFATAQWSDNDCIASHYIELVVPTTIARLLALAPDAGAVEVLKALRGET